MLKARDWLPSLCGVGIEGLSRAWNPLGVVFFGSKDFCDTTAFPLHLWNNFPQLTLKHGVLTVGPSDFLKLWGTVVPEGDRLLTSGL